MIENEAHICVVHCIYSLYMPHIFVHHGLNELKMINDR